MIDLKLTTIEAAVLFRILGSVGGDPEGFRGQINSINDKLRAILNVKNRLDVVYPMISSGSVMLLDHDQIDQDTRKRMQDLIDQFEKYEYEQHAPVMQGGEMQYNIYNDRRLDELEDAIDSLQADMNNLRLIINF